MDFTESLALRRDDILDRCTKCGRCVEACPMPGPAGIDNLLKASWGLPPGRPPEPGSS